MYQHQPESILSIGRPASPEWVSDFTELLLDTLPESVIPVTRVLPGIVYIHAHDLEGDIDPDSPEDVQDLASEISCDSAIGIETLIKPQDLDLYRILVNVVRKSSGNKIRVAAAVADRRIGDGARGFLIRSEQDAVRKYLGETPPKVKDTWGPNSFPIHKIRLATIRGDTDNINFKILRDMQLDLPPKFPLMKLGLVST